MQRIKEKFLRYVKINTRSIEDVEKIPSSEGQWTLAHLLKDELVKMGIENAFVDENCFVFAWIPSNLKDKNVPAIGFIAHLDTAAESNAENVQPQIFENYDGGEIVINSELNVILNPEEYPELKKYIGDDIITGGGETLLGADDKAGISIIMEMAERILENPQIKHGKICIAFTPDEEISIGGASIFDVDKFGADFAYTVDGDGIGELNFENFNAAEVILEFRGKSIHPGEAKDKMINASLLASEYINSLPKGETPEDTEGYEGFFHLLEMTGDVENAKLLYMIRDFEEKEFNERKQKMIAVANTINNKYTPTSCDIKITDEYMNMKNAFNEKMHIVETGIAAYRDCGIENPILIPIRGGTDGATLALKGLPAPNIFMGGHNYHSVNEFVSINAMEKATEIIIRIVELYAER